MERRTHFRARSRDGRRLGLKFRPLAAPAGDDPERYGGDRDGAAAGGEPDWVSSQARDVGVGGAFVATYRALPVGTELEVEVDLPGSDGPVPLRAVVRWLAEPGRLPPGCEAGMGLAFGSLEAEALLALSDYLASLAEGRNAG